MRRRIGVAVVAAAITLLFGSQAAFAGSPHFVTADASRTGNTLTVDFKEAGLGNEPRSTSCSAPPRCASTTAGIIPRP